MTRQSHQSSINFRNPIFLIWMKFLKWYLILGAVLRLILQTASPADASFTFGETIRALGIGFVADLGMGLLLSLPLQVIYLGLNEWKYGRRTGLIIESLLAAAFVYVMFFHTIFNEYGGGAPMIARAFFGWKLASFTLRCFLPDIRMVWRRVSLYFAWGVYVFLMLFILMGEYLFWDEFGVRYNFIAVDYLVYTHEVIGNIMESYAILPIVLVTLILTVGIIWWESRRNRFRLSALYTPRLLAIHLGIVACVLAVGFGLSVFTHGLRSDDQYVTQLEQNGAYDFLYAFHNNHLDYRNFYPLLPERECKDLYQQANGLDDGYMRVIRTDSAARRKNIVVITVESLSADFLARYGDRKGLTPQLNALARRSLVLDSLYAAGNRTVRGLEALSLCIPPTAGESIIKQHDNRMGGRSVGSLLQRMGYVTQFIYGGDSYFDNMGDYFSHNGYAVIDRNQISPDSITFANIWGVCDEDVYRKSLSVFDANAAAGKPFFAQIMTTSNHRPYTYPAGKIRVAGKPNTREAAVKYTDYAIGRFLSEAARKPWFANTVFVVIADHCASSAGKTSLPVERYHIPCLIYSPGFVRPQVFTRRCSQIDVVPTLLSMLRLSVRAPFTGRDIFAPDYRPRAFMATYQDLGYWEGDRLTVLSPVRHVVQYAVSRKPDGTFVETPVAKPDGRLVRKTQAAYQYVNIYYRQ